MLDAVLPIHSIGFRTQYIAVFVTSETVYSPVPTVLRGTTPTVFPALFRNFFRNHMIIVRM